MSALAQKKLRSAEPLSVAFASEKCGRRVKRSKRRWVWEFRLGVENRRPSGSKSVCGTPTEDFSSRRSRGWEILQHRSCVSPYRFRLLRESAWREVAKGPDFVVQRTQEDSVFHTDLEETRRRTLSLSLSLSLSLTREEGSFLIRTSEKRPFKKANRV